MNKIVHGDMTVEADAAGVGVAAVRDHLRDALSIPVAATAFLDGLPASDDATVPAWADLEFLRVHGQKSVGRVWTPDEACAVLGCTPADLDAWVRGGLRVLTLLDGGVRITETAVDEFVRGVQAAPDLGPAPHPTPAPERAEEAADECSDLSTLQAMAEIGCSRGMIYKLCKSGELAHRRVGSQYRISREAVVEYRRRTSVEARPRVAAEPGGYRFRHL